MTKASNASLASIIIVTYNSRRYIDDNIGSLIKRLPDGCEVIVVDNASSDGTAEEIARSFPTVRLVQNQTNVGFAPANNQAARLARGEYLVLLNPDTAADGQWLEPLLQPLRERRTAAGAPVGLTTPKIVMMNNPSIINTAGNDVHISGITACRGYGCATSARDYQSDAVVPAVSGACFAIRADLWQQLGGFDESFFMYLEDTDLSLRAQLAGFSCLYVAASTVSHDYKNAFSPQKIFFLERNRLLMIAKNFRTRTVLALLPALIAIEFLSIGYAALQGMSAMRSVFSAYIDSVRWITAEKAKPLQANSKVSDRAILARMTTRLPLTQVSVPAVEELINLLLTPLFNASLALARWLA